MAFFHKITYYKYDIPYPMGEGQFLHEPFHVMKLCLVLAHLLLCEPMYQFKLIASTIYNSRIDNSHHLVYGILAMRDLFKYHKKITLNISKWHKNLIQPPI